MSIVVSMGELRDAAAALRIIQGAKLPAAAAYRVGRMLRAIKDPVASYDAARDALLVATATPITDKPGEFRVHDTARFSREMKELDAQTVEIHVSPIKFGDLPQSIEPVVFSQLHWFIEGEPPDQAPAPAHAPPPP